MWTPSTSAACPCTSPRKTRRYRADLYQLRSCCHSLSTPCTLSMPCTSASQPARCQGVWRMGHKAVAGFRGVEASAVHQDLAAFSPVTRLILHCIHTLRELAPAQHQHIIAKAGSGSQTGRPRQLRIPKSRGMTCLSCAGCGHGAAVLRLLPSLSGPGPVPKILPGYALLRILSGQVKAGTRTAGILLPLTAQWQASWPVVPGEARHQLWVVKLRAEHYLIGFRV